MTRKKLFLALACAGLVASVVAGREKPSSPALEPPARIDTRIRVAEELDLSGLERKAPEGAKADLFGNFDAKPAAPQGPGKPAKPTAPPLPFAYLGKVIEDGKAAVFLSRGGESYSVAAGDTIGGEYRVDAVSDREITFTYLPLKTKQRLPL